MKKRFLRQRSFDNIGDPVKSKIDTVVWAKVVIGFIGCAQDARQGAKPISKVGKRDYFLNGLLVIIKKNFFFWGGG